MAGNNYQSEVETTRADAGIGCFLKGEENGNFNFLNNLETGFFADKDVRNMLYLNSGDAKLVLVANNKNKYDFFEVKN